MISSPPTGQQRVDGHQPTDGVDAVMRNPVGQLAGDGRHDGCRGGEQAHRAFAGEAAAEKQQGVLVVIGEARDYGSLVRDR